MDLRQYMGVPLRRYKEIIVIIAIFMLAAWYFTSQVKTTYPVTLFYTISLDDSQETEEFKYSNFYATHSGLEFSRTVSGWFDDPALEAKAFELAEVNRDEEMTLFKKLFGFFRAKRIERQNIQINFDTYEDARSHKLADAMTTVLKNRLDEYNQGSNSDYRVVLASKWVERKDPNLSMNLTLSFFIGLFFGLMSMYIYEYLAGRISIAHEAEEIFGKEALSISCSRTWPTNIFEKLLAVKKPSQLIKIGKFKLISKKNFPEIISFPDNVESIDDKNKNFIVIKLGISTSSDLKSLVSVLGNDNMELIILT